VSTRLAVGDSDVFWHLVLGRQALQGSIALPEALSGLSWTASGFAGSSDQWFGQTLLALAFDAGGWRWVVALRAVAVALLVGLIDGTFARPELRRTYAAMAIGSLIATLLTPAHLDAWTAPGFHLLHPPREIQEWSIPDVTTLPGAIFALAVFATLATAI